MPHVYYYKGPGEYIWGTEVNPIPAGHVAIAESDFYAMVAADKAAETAWMAASLAAAAVRDAAYTVILDAARRKLLAGTRMTADEAAAVLGEPIASLPSAVVPFPIYQVSPHLSMPEMAAAAAKLKPPQKQVARKA